MPFSFFLAGILSIAASVFGAGITFGQDYPGKPIRIVTSAAGGGTDFVARLIAQELAAALGQPMIVDDRPIALGDILPKAPPNGYTLQFVADST